ncbi:MAG: hypothetical protein WD227_02345 [Vicinamibacterales bacterium]
MEATIVLVLVFTFLVGGMTLALAMGYRSIEESRSEQRPERHVQPAPAAYVMAGHGFFERAADRTPAPPAIAFDDALLAQLERHVRAEQAAVSQFVHFPSVDSLYSSSGTSLRVH